MALSDLGISSPAAVILSPQALGHCAHAPTPILVHNMKLDMHSCCLRSQKRPGPLTTTDSKCQGQSHSHPGPIHIPSTFAAALDLTLSVPPVPSRSPPGQTEKAAASNAMPKKRRGNRCEEYFILLLGSKEFIGVFTSPHPCYPTYTVSNPVSTANILKC